MSNLLQCDFCHSAIEKQWIWPTAVRYEIDGPIYKTGRHVCDQCSPKLTTGVGLFYLPYGIYLDQQGQPCWTITLIKNWSEET
jgi:hypothetical protein